MTHTQTERIRAKRTGIVCRTCATQLGESILKSRNYFALTSEQINELEEYAYIFNYKQSKRSIYDGISYLRDFYYYLCK